MALFNSLGWIALCILLLCSSYTANCTFVYDYPMVSINISENSVPEGNRIQIPVSMTNVTASTLPCYVTYYTQDGTANAGEDYFPAFGKLMLSVNDTIKFISILTLREDMYEPDENFFLVLNTSLGCHIQNSRVKITVVDDTPRVVEGLQIDVPLSLSAPAIAPCYATYWTQDGTATSGTDYEHTMGAVFWDIGQTTQTVSVFTLVDTEIEANETLFLVLNSSGCSIPSQTIQLIVIDNPVIPTVSVWDTIAPELTERGLRFTVSLSAPQVVPVYFTVTTAQGTAVADRDYESTIIMGGIEAGKLSFGGKVNILDDNIHEDLEFFYLHLENSTNAILGATTAEASIRDNDPMPTLSVSTEATVNEADGTYYVVASLIGATEVNVNFTCAFSSGTAKLGSDFVANSGELSFMAPSYGLLTASIPVTILQDALDEDTETFTFSFLDAENATILPSNASQVISILDDDPLPNCFISTPPPVVYEEMGLVTIGISLSVPSGRDVTVQFFQTPRSATPADYVPLNTAITFPAGSTSTQVSIIIVQDTLSEPVPETFLAIISAPVNCVITVSNVTVTIMDSPPRPSTLVIPSASPSRSPGLKSLAVVESDAHALDDAKPGIEGYRWLAGIAVGAVCLGLVVGAVFFATKRNSNGDPELQTVS